MAGVEPAVPVEGAVPLGVGVVPGGLAVGADEGPEDGAGDPTVLSLELVAAVLLLRLAVGDAELAGVARDVVGLHYQSLSLGVLSSAWSLTEKL